MAKGDVTMKFDAQTAAFIQTIEAARQKMEAGASSARKFGDDVAKAGDKSKWGFMNALEGAKGMAIGVIGVTSAAALLEKGVDAAGKMVERRFDLMKQRTEELLGKVKTLNSALADTGQPGKGPAARNDIEEIIKMRPGGKAVGSKEVTDTYVAITRALGNSVDAKESTIAAQKARAAGMTDEGAQQMGIIHGQLSREGITGKRAEDLAYMAATNKMGELNFRTFFRAGGDENALRLMVAASRVSEGQRKVDSILETSEKRHIPVATLLANPNLAPKDQRAAISSIADAAGKVSPKTLDEAIAERKANGDEESKVAKVQGMANRLGEQLLEDDALPDAVEETRRNYYKAKFAREHPYLDTIPLVGRAYAQDQVVRYGNFEHAREMGGETGPNPFDPMVVQKQIDALNKNTEATQQNSQVNNGGPALKNNSEGQK